MTAQMTTAAATTAPATTAQATTAQATTAAVPAATAPVTTAPTTSGTVAPTTTPAPTSPTTTTCSKCDKWTLATTFPPEIEMTCQSRCVAGHQCCAASQRCVPIEMSCENPPPDCIDMCANGFYCCGSAENRCLKVGEQCPCPDCATPVAVGEQCPVGQPNEWGVTAASGNFKCCAANCP